MCRWDGCDFITKIGNGLNMHKPGVKSTIMTCLDRIRAKFLSNHSRSCHLEQFLLCNAISSSFCTEMVQENIQIPFRNGFCSQFAALSCAYVLFNRFYARNGFHAPVPAGWTIDEWMVRCSFPNFIAPTAPISSVSISYSRLQRLYEKLVLCPSFLCPFPPYNLSPFALSISPRIEIVLRPSGIHSSCMYPRDLRKSPTAVQTYLPPPFNKDLSWKLVAVACLFLAGKVEDNPKKIQDV
jgi:hypothetical protein